MTNPPNEPTPKRHDLSPEDLRLTAPKPTHRRDSISAQDAQGTEAPTLLIAQSHRHSRSRKKKKHPVRKALLIIALSLLSFVVVVAGTVLVLQSAGRTALLPSSDVTVTAPDEILQNPEVEISDDGRTVVYKGERYTFNENRTNILCIGMDKESMDLDNNTVGTGGQADSLMVVSVDTATGQVDALAVSRDTMVDIELYSADGSFYGIENTQICLSYAYGDGRETSCENTVRAASRLLYGIPINTYFAIDLSSIATLNDAVGGVEVQLLKDLKRNDGSTSYMGETVTLHGDEAQQYVQFRDTSRLDSNNDRMERQMQYITAFFNKALTATKSDLQVPLTLYSTIAEDSTTNLSPAKITYLATKLVQHGGAIAFTKVPGTVVQSADDGYAEYIVDQEALYEQVLQLFYTKIS